MNNNWFESRGLRVLTYQDTAITKVQESLEQREITVLAACPSAGKTLMTIYMMEEWLRQNPNSKIMVLAHGTTILRTQFHDVLVKYKPDFTYALIESYDDYKKSTASVNICLPQTLKKHIVNPIDLLIVDEAHHFYVSANAKMIKDIIKQSKVKKQLLLTGTPSKFILENLRLNIDKYHIIPVTLNTIFDAGMVSEAYVEVASSTYKFNMDDYNEEDELKTSIHFKLIETNKTLDDLLEKIVYRLRSFRGNVYTNITPDWKILLKELKKTMFACRSIQQAEQVAKYLEKRNINYALSTSENDIDSLQIKRFKEEEDCLVLIVVYRGVLGFNYEKLVNVVDMTTSHNVDRIYQLFSRVIRIDEASPTQKKLFFKISPNMLTDYYKHIMTAVLMLSDEEFFTKFNGKNFNDMEIPVKQIYKSNKHSLKPNTNSHQKTRKYQPIDMDGLPVFEFFKNILHKKDELLVTYCMTTIRDVRGEFLDYTQKHYWTFEKCKEDALKYETKKDWNQNNNTAYQIAQRNGWMKECSKHMIELVKRDYWTKEKCLEDALKYNKLSDWYDNNQYAVAIARKNGWYEECVVHMERSMPNGYWTKERCLESVLKYQTPSEWLEKDSGAFYGARYNGWYKELISHMNKKINRTKETCIENALNYEKQSEWIKNENGAYNAARINDWLSECTTHMEKRTSNGYWTKERCLESALNYETIKNWTTNEGGAYNAAKKHGWFEECTAHMTKKNKKLQGYWTKENCINDAKNYRTRIKWERNSGGAYGAAQRNGWLEECCNHMIKEKVIRKLHWTKEACIESAKKYVHKSEWSKNECGAVNSAIKNKWYDECTAHMEKEFRWTKEMCIENALRYNTKSEWMNNDNNIYAAACKHGWLNDCTKHMKNLRKSWTKEMCIENALDCNSIYDWQKKKGTTAYGVARRNGWVKECTSHMKNNKPQ